jgi:hypothetical protein
MDELEYLEAPPAPGPAGFRWKKLALWLGVILVAESIRRAAVAARRARADREADPVTDI